MKLYELTINDYGHGDRQHAIVRASSKEEAYEIVQKEGHRIDDAYVRVLDNYATLAKGIVTIL